MKSFFYTITEYMIISAFCFNTNINDNNYHDNKYRIEY